MLPERVVVGTSAVTVLLLILAASGDIIVWNLPGVGILLAALVNSVFLVYSYRSEPSVKDLLVIKSKFRAINDQITATTGDINAADRAKMKHRNKHAVDQAKIAKEQKAVEATEKKEIATRQKALQLVLSSINTRRQALHQQEADALRKVQRDVGAKVAALTQQIGTLTQAEATELANMLKAQQQQHIIAYLRRFALEAASISGVGPSFKSRLKIAGFQTAADIDVYRVQRVRGIGPSRATSLAAWRRSIESRAQASMPQALSQSDTTAIQTKYQSQRLPLVDERDRAQRRQRDEEDAIRARYGRSIEQLDTEESVANTKTKGEIDEIRARYARQYDSFRETLSKLADESASTLREIDGGISETRKKLFSLHWEKEKERRRLKTFEGIRFSKYVKRLFVGSRAA